MRDICADCNKPDPTWASLNRGILLCEECALCHRSLGRHVSWVRSLQQGWWSPTLLMMVEALNKAGANSVWEYSLLDQTAAPTGCKPSFSDPARTAKEDFIRSKHEHLAFILRSEQDADGPEGIGAQLHAAARTSDLLTSLRLFSQGADPNFYHEEKGSCPLHVAAKTNQTLQAELLMIYGADLCRRDSAGRTPEDVARDSGHVPLAERLHTARFHVFDRLLQYLCSRKPGMSVEVLGGFNRLEELSLDNGGSNEGRLKLESLSNSQFEKVVADLYDEVDRRESGSAWQGSESGAGLGVDPAAFLPPHPELSATRNQGRQKLGRLTPRDLDQLLRDVLRDARRRDISMLQGKQGAVQQSSPVPRRTDISDDEPLYDSVASDEDYASTNGGEVLPPPSQSQPGILTSLQSQPTSLVNSQFAFNTQDDSCLRRSLVSPEATIARLQSEVQLLHDQMTELKRENRELRDELTRCRSYPRAPDLPRDVQESASERMRGLRPTSMYEARDRPRNWTGMRGAPGSSQGLSHSWPEYSEVTRRTDHVTKRIQELCEHMKNLNLPYLVASAARIRLAVADLTAIFPQVPTDELIRDLTTSSKRLELECGTAPHCLPSAQEQSLKTIRNIAYDIAKATKQLIMRAQSHCPSQQ